MSFVKKTVVIPAILALGLAGGAFAQSVVISDEPVIAADSTAPGPYAGWPVLSSDGMRVGTVEFSPEAVDGNLAFVVVRAENGNQFKINNGIAAIGNDALTLKIDKSYIDANNSKAFTTFTVVQ